MKAAKKNVKYKKEKYCKGIDYSTYIPPASEKFLFGAEGLLIVSVIGYLFYRTWIAILIFSPFILFYIKEKEKEKREKRIRTLNLEFKEAMIALVSALNAGYSIENAFKEGLKDLYLIYGQESLITKEFQYMVGQIEMNVTIESLLEEFAGRSGIEDIKSFSEVFSTAKRSGGDLIMIIQSTVENISQKIEVQREIITLLTQKQFEQKIMNAVPFIIIIYVNISSPGFLDPLYGNVAGVIIMTACLGIYLTSYYISKKIVKIDI